MQILAIETSCDDTGIAVLEHNRSGQPKILANFVSSQVKIHAPWGGVVPMLAKREHQRNLTPLLIKALGKAKLLKAQRAKSKGQSQNLQLILEREPQLLKKLLPFLKKYQKPPIDYIAVTQGPGLEPALWVGINFARALGYWWGIPLLPINHIEGHLIAAFSAGESREIFNFPRPRQAKRGGQFSIFNKNHLSILPAICLVASGGHTQLILVKKIGRYEIVGETRDDAAGEAFDKVAKMLKLGYPGGPAIAALAAKFKIESLKLKISLPRPMLNSGNFDFSFSGLKTAVLYQLQKMTAAQIKKNTPAIAAEFQQAVIDVLIAKTLSAAKKYSAKTLLLAGGVAANHALRDNLSLAANRLSLKFLVPPINLCMDNAVMIALTAAYRLKQHRAKKTSWRRLQAQANLRIS